MKKLLIFTYATTGLGHLRVTDALADSRPKNFPFVLLGDRDTLATWMHRFTSINPFGKFIFLKSQYGLLEKIFDNLYTRFLLKNTQSLFEEIKEIILKEKEVDEIWIIATHFGMAHQLGAIKDSLMRVTGKKIRLIVQVTDATFQYIWCIRGADLTFVPSMLVKEKLEARAKKLQMPFKGEVIPYPLSQLLTTKLSESLGKRNEVFVKNEGVVRVAVPISGAAAGVPYLIQLILRLRKLSTRFEFWVLIERSVYTRWFIDTLAKIPGVIVLVSESDKEMVDLYELMYKENLIHLELTKPSEQAFKAIISPEMVGGSILLFTAPVGRQEIDNLDFLMSHEIVQKQKSAPVTIPLETMPASLRGFILDNDPASASRFIYWATTNGVFGRMTGKDFSFSKKSLSSGEIGPDGTKLFWQKLAERFGQS